MLLSRYDSPHLRHHRSRTAIMSALSACSLVIVEPFSVCKIASGRSVWVGDNVCEWCGFVKLAKSFGSLDRDSSKAVKCRHQRIEIATDEAADLRVE